MDYSAYLKNYTPDGEKLIGRGFTRKGEEYVLEKDLTVGDLFTRITIGNGRIEVKVYDRAFDDEYLPFNVVGGGGAVRGEVEALLEEIIATCFVRSDVRSILISRVEGTFKVKAENPFENYPEAVAFYTPVDRKWFAIILNARKKALGLKGDGEIEVVNVKASPEDIAALVDGDRYFYAYHMNKKSWLSVALDKFTDIDTLLKLIEKSFRLAGGKL